MNSLKTTGLRLTSFIKRHPKIDISIVAFGVLVYAVVSLWTITEASIWFDEAFSTYIAQFSYADIARFTAADVHPPLYYWALKTWEMFFGTSELAVRSMSVLFGGIAIIFAYLTTRKLFGRKTALIALSLLVISPMLIRYGQEARMYTMAAAIVMAATYALLVARDSTRKLPWIVYGVLIAAGMWTNYFTALAWLAHWAWHAVVVRQNSGKKLFWKNFFSKRWIATYALAVALFLPWLPFMFLQLGGIQGTGFWIGSVGVDTPANYLSNIFFYLEHGQVNGWLAVLFFILVAILSVLGVRSYKVLSKHDRLKYLLVLLLAFAPVVILFIVSLPPLKSSFVERYLVPSVVAFSVFAAIAIAVGLRRAKGYLTPLVVVVLLVGSMIYGVYNVIYFGNYNKNSNTHIMTKELVEGITRKAKPGEPIVANSPWIFYEAVFYSTDRNPVYFIDKNTDYKFGSLDMLRDTDLHKIKDFNAFAAQHPTIWYIGNTNDEDVAPYQQSWRKIDTVWAYDSINDKKIYRGTQYQVSVE